jgi:chitin-binding protein
MEDQYAKGVTYQELKVEDQNAETINQHQLKVEEFGQTFVRLSWKPRHTDERSYSIQQVQQGGDEFYNLPVGQTSLTITGLTPGVEYGFKMKAEVDSGFEFPYTPSSLVRVKTLNDPLDIKFWSVERTQIILYLTKSGISYDLEINSVPKGRITAPPYHHEFNELTPGQRYVFRLRANIEDEWTELVTQTPRDKPTPPPFFEAFGQTADQVSFYWSPGTVDGGQPRYEIRRDGQLLDTPAAPPYTDTAPQQGREHTYCIRTVDDQFNLSEPVCIIVRFEDFTAPTDPSNLRTGNLSLTLSWGESYDSSGDITYKVDQGLGNELGTTKESEFAITGLQSGQRYEFGVTAVDKAGHQSNRVVIQYPALGISLKGKK